MQKLTRWRVATELFQVLPKESLYARETEMCQPRAGVEKLDDALYRESVSGPITHSSMLGNYLERELRAVAEVYSFKTAAAGIRFSYVPSICVPTLAESLVGLSKRIYGHIGDVAAFDEANSLKLGKNSQPGDGFVRQVQAAAQVNIPYTIAEVDQTLDSFVGQVHAVAEVDVMQVLAELRDGEDGLVGNVTAFCEDEISKARGGIDDLLNSTVGDSGTGGKVEDAEVVKDHPWGKRQECAVVNELTHCEPELSERGPLCEEIGDGGIANQLALMQVNLEDVGAMLGEGKDGFVRHLAAVVQLEL